MNILSIDLGGTSAKIALVSSKGEILKEQNIKTDKNSIVKNISEKLTINNTDFEIIAFAAPGAIDSKDGVIKWSGNLEVENFSIKNECNKYFKKPSYILNDANAAILGEVWLGAAKGVDNCLMYTLGTGIGGGIVLNGKIVTGEFGFAGELGHGGNFQSKIACTCGNKNCIEPVASSVNIEKKVNNYIFKNNLTDKYKEMNLGEKYLKGDKEIKKIFLDAFDILSDHISTMIYALDPKLVLIGGGIASLGNIITNIIEKNLQNKVGKVFLENKEFKVASLGNRAGFLGAAYYALKETKNETN